MSFLLMWLGLQISLSWEPLWLPKLILVAASSSKPPSSISRLPPVQQKGLASGYAPWEEEHIWLRKGKKLRVSNGKPFCSWHGYVKKGDPIIAHRWLPCGTRVFVSTVGKPQQGAWLIVGDRGPYGACVERSKLPAGAIWTNSKLCQRQYGSDTVWYVKRRSRDPGTWRAVADISHDARKLIGHNGFENIVLRWWKKPPSKRPQTSTLVAVK